MGNETAQLDRINYVPSAELAVDDRTIPGSLAVASTTAVEAISELEVDEALVVAPSSLINDTQLDKPEQKRPPTSQSHRTSEKEAVADKILQIYYSDISKTPLIDKAKEATLGKLIMDGQKAAEELSKAEVEKRRLPALRKRELKAAVEAAEEAKHTFVKSNLRLVVHIAKKYSNSKVELVDRIQEGNFGLMHAVDKFDYRKGFKFSTYATWWVRQAITRGIANTENLARIPIHTTDELVLMRKTIAELSKERQDEPSDEEVAERMNISPEKLRFLKQIEDRRTVFSLDRETDPDSTRTTNMTEAIPDPKTSTEIDKSVDDIANAEEIERLLGFLNDEEIRIIRYKFGLDTGDGKKGPTEIAEALNLPLETVKANETSAMRKLKKASGVRPRMRGRSKTHN